LKRLRFLAQVNPPTPEFDGLQADEEVAFVPLEDVWPAPRWIPEQRRRKSDVGSGYTRFSEGDVLVPKITPTFEAGRSVVAKGLATTVAAGTTELHVVRTREADSRYLNYVFQSKPFLEGGAASMVGVAGQKRVPEGWVLNYWISIDDLRSQSHIADFLDTTTARIDALIEKKRRTIKLLNERRVAIIAAEVLNHAWPRVKLTLLARLGSGHTPSRSRPDWWEHATIPWITTGDIAQMRGDHVELIENTKFSISELGLANSAAELHPAGTVVLSRTASVGFSAIMARPMATSQDFATWTCGAGLEARFLLLCLRAMRAELVGRLAMGSTHKTIYMPDIEAIRVPVPTRDEQERVVEETWARLRPIDVVIDKIERQIALLREHRQALITAAVTGELDVAKAAA
jgi:type I restriction enzyme S subunit